MVTTNQEQRVARRIYEHDLIENVASYVSLMTPSRATELLETSNYERQRRLRSDAIDGYAQAIERGEMTSVTVTMAEARDTGKVCIIDGQHRLHALIRHAATLPCVFIVHRVDGDEDIARMFSVIDRPIVRNASDSLRAFGIDEEAGLSPTVMRLAQAAVAIAESGFSRSYTSQTNLIRKSLDTREWIPQIQAYVACIDGAAQDTSRMLWRSPVAAVALATLRDCSDVASSFWRELALDDGLRRGDPRATLLAWLRANTMHSGASRIEYALYVAAAWNAHVGGRSLEKLVVRDRAAAVRLVGTSFNGGR